MPSYFNESVYVDGGRIWVCHCSVFTLDAAGVEARQPSLLIPSCKSQHHGGEDMRSVAIGT